jgi:hypothetical protein
MARRKKASRKYSRRRKSMGAAATSMVTDIAGLAAGAIVAKQLNKMLKFDARILAAGKVALGLALPKFVKTPIMKSVGNGMIAIGATELVGSFVPALAGTDDLVLLSGLDEIGEIDMIGEGDEMIGADIAEVNGTDIAEVNGLDEIGEIEMI